ncbi:hypothetical protein [Arthrospiribacter ruber]|uniref:hypothetical protein n=1 Tax=Arthrospiribacter ruber TaxID=2487934 RepID=UPI001C5B673A|nr:hypothetical protein [Arthrospiribacter ruber]
MRNPTRINHTTDETASKIRKFLSSFIAVFLLNIQTILFGFNLLGENFVYHLHTKDAVS